MQIFLYLCTNFLNNNEEISNFKYGIDGVNWRKLPK